MSEIDIFLTSTGLTCVMWDNAFKYYLKKCSYNLIFLFAVPAVMEMNLPGKNLAYT